MREREPEAGRPYQRSGSDGRVFVSGRTGGGLAGGGPYGHRACGRWAVRVSGLTDVGPAGDGPYGRRACGQASECEALAHSLARSRSKKAPSAAGQAGGGDVSRLGALRASFAIAATLGGISTCAVTEPSHRSRFRFGATAKAAKTGSRQKSALAIDYEASWGAYYPL